VSDIVSFLSAFSVIKYLSEEIKVTTFNDQHIHIYTYNLHMHSNSLFCIGRDKHLFGQTASSCNFRCFEDDITETQEEASEREKAARITERSFERISDQKTTIASEH